MVVRIAGFDLDINHWFFLRVDGKLSSQPPIRYKLVSEVLKLLFGPCLGGVPEQRLLVPIFYPLTLIYIYVYMYRVREGIWIILVVCLV